MPPPNEPAFVSDLLENERLAAGFIFNWQNRVVENDWTVQNLTRRQAISRVSREVKDRLKTVNDQHLERMRTGFFDEIYRAGARSIDPAFVMTPVDTRKVQAMGVEYYTKMRNARAFAGRDSERFVSHVWEDTKDRRKMFGRTTKYLDRFGFQGRPGSLNFIEDPAGVERMDKRFGVKAAVGVDGRKWSYTKYARMQGDAFGNKLYNEGALNAAERLALKGKNIVIVVSDGPDCGWTYHEDPEKADGMVVSIAEARANPIAHPHCVRRFSVSTKPKDREKVSKRETLAKTASKALTAVAVTGLTAYASSAAANVAASAFARFAASDLYEAYIDHLRQLMFQGDHAAQHFLRAAVRLQDRMINWDPVIAASRQKNAQLFPFTHAVNRMWPGGPDVTEVSEVFQGLRAVGDDLIHHTTDDLLAASRQVPDNVLHFLNRNWPGHRTEEQMQLAFEGMQKFVRNEETRKNIVSVVNAEFQRRNVLHNVLLRIPGGEAFASKVTLTWSQWGQRLRLDPFDWLRGHVTFTPSGLIRSLSFFPKTAYRGVVKMYADGSIGGHLSALPKNFLNGVFRAIVEIDEHGALVGNIRIVPKGPLRVTLNFITKQPKEVAERLAEDFTTYLKFIRGDEIANMTTEQIAQHLITFIQGHPAPLGFDVRDLANAVVRNAREAKLIDEGPMAKRLKEIIEANGAKLTYDVRDIVESSRTFGAARVARDLGYGVRQFRFHSAKIEWRIFNKSIFDISANLRLPVALVKSTVESLRLQHALSVSADGLVTGTFKFAIHTPEELFKIVRFTSRTLQEEGQVGLRSTLFGNIRFSGLKASENNVFLNALRTGKVRFLTRAHFDQDGLAEIATNMRIFGWNIYDIANVLKVRVADIKAAVAEGFARTHLMAYRLGFTKLDDAIPLWDSKVESVRQMFATNEAPVGRADAMLRVVKTMKGEFANPVDERALKFLAGIKPSDSPTQIRLKLTHLRNWINTVEARPGIVYRDWEARGVFNPFTGFPPDVDGNIIKMLYMEAGETAKFITAEDIAAKADEIYRGLKVFRLRADLTYTQAVEKVDYYFGRFQSFFLTKGWAQDHILRAWDTLVTHFDIITKKFIPNSWADHTLTADQLRIIDNWKNYAVPEGQRAFRVGDVRFSVADDAWLSLNKQFEGTLVDAVDETYVKEVLKDSTYLRRRFPNVDLPEHRLVMQASGPSTTYYEDGIIHWAWQWGDNFESANKETMLLHHLDQVSGHQLLFRRRNMENSFRRVYFHEYGHYLVDHLTNKQVDDLLEVIDREFRLHTLLHDPTGMSISLDNIARQGYRPRDPLGNAFAAWERQAKLRRNFTDESTIESLHNTQRFLGKYSLMNPDELSAEAISHYLNFRDPSRLARTIGEFFDEKIVGTQGRLLASQSRPTFINKPGLDVVNIEEVFQAEVPSRATIHFLRRADALAKKASEGVSPETFVDDTEKYLMSVFHNQPGVDNLDDAVRWYWTEDFDHVKAVRAAWQELNGVPSSVRYTDRDIVSALRLQKMWDEASTASEKKLYRGLQATEKGTPNIDPAAMEHVEKLLTVGEQFRLPMSSFTDKLDVAMTHATWDASNPGILIEVEQGARAVPLFPERTVSVSQAEILSQGVFEVVRVERNWVPTEGNFRVMLKQNLAEGASQQSVDQWMRIFRQQASGDITRVVLRRIAD